MIRGKTGLAWPRGKVFMLIMVVVLYAAVAGALLALVNAGTISRLPPTPLDLGGNDSLPAPPSIVSARLEAAQKFMDTSLVRKNGHVDLYLFARGEKGNESSFYAQHANTNSEAASYRLLIAAKAKDKEAFDTELAFIQQHMLEPDYGYMMWRLEDNDTAVGEGRNVAPDADLRAIEALTIAEKQWGDKEYTQTIDTIAKGLEDTSITADGMLAAYGGASGPASTWTTNEVYLSYTDFNAIKELSDRRGEPWTTMYGKMKKATLGAQIYNGLYNQQLTEVRAYGSGLDGGGYSINSMWMMVRNAESGDPELRASAQRSLDFFKSKYGTDLEIYTTYDSTGNAISPGDAPWAYALVGRAAVALGDKDFADQMVRKLLEFQVQDERDPYYGAFMEGSGDDLRVGQFTMQESILTLQDYVDAQAQLQ